MVNKGDKLVSLQKDSPQKEKQTTELKSIRPPLQFTQRSPIPTDNEDCNEVEKFEKMKLAELKEVAKSNGIKGYSKLKKIDLVELLTCNGKSTVNKGDKLVSLQKDSPQKEKETTELKSIRPPSQFTRRSPTTDNSEDSNEVEKFEKMKLAELKEVAKSNGIKGYSKLKKIELVELLTSNGV
ncbi:Rho termination factor [Striga asiatica]|uniref:Rho termination factor n=1 Tax=Striga asiatica TaxID=4170 RepID=A0A5A7NWK8_STRAF|nr:Rho termination factor [Striga asiatica]